MKKSFLVIDDFLDDYKYKRSVALSKEFIDFEFGGEFFKNYAVDDGDFPWGQVSDIVGTPVTPILSLYSLALSSEGPSASHWIHTDKSMGDPNWAIVIYLCSKPRGVLSGTGTFKHIELGVHNFLDSEKVANAGLDMIGISDILEADNNSPEKWELSEFSAVVPNRVVIYPASRYHGKVPYEGFGDTVENGRLTWVGFCK